jgi:hypothetical protein
MKKIYLLTLALGALLAVSCQKENNVQAPQKLVPMTFEASYAENPETRATLDELAVKWSENDEVAIYDNVNPTTPHKFTVSAIDGTKASFTGEVSEGAEFFLAVYPYDAATPGASSTTYNSVAADTWYSNAVIPSEQNAVAGSFDPKALVATGGCSLEDGKFRFRYTGALLKFQVSDDDVTSVTFSSTRNMSGIIQFNQKSAQANGPSGIGNGLTTYGQRYTNVTVKANGTFTKGTDYYAFIRYTGTASYENFKAILTNTQGGTAEKAASAVFNVQRKTIYDMGNFAGLTWNNPVEGNIDLYKKYNDGENIVICGKTYNKSTHGEAVLLTSTASTPKNLGGSNLSGAGNVVFLAPGQYTTAGDATFDHDIVVIGQMTGEKPEVTTIEYTNSNNKQALKTWIVKGVSFAACNILFTFPAENGTAFTFFTNNNAAKDIPLFAFEDCVVRKCPTNFYSTHSSAYGYGITDIRVNNCVFENSNAGTSNLINVQSSMTNGPAFEKISLTNNVFYNSTGSVCTWLLFTYYPSLSSTMTALTWPMVADISNNIFYNIASNSSNFRNYSMTSLTVKNNLVVCPDYTPSNGQKIFAMRVKPVPSYFHADYADNRAFAAAGSESNWILGDDDFTKNLTPSFDKKIPLLGENPLETADLENGVFVVKTAYKSYGPQN